MRQQTMIGERIRAARFAAHLTQGELAGERFSKSYISALERGKMMPSFQALRYLAERLAVPVSSLLEEHTNDKEAREQERQAHEEEQARLLGEAESLLQQGCYEEAIARFEALKHQDRTCAAHAAFAQFLASQGRYQEAYEQMRLSLSW